MATNQSNSQAFEAVSVPISDKDREGGSYKMGKDIPDGAYTFTTLKVAPSKRCKERKVIHGKITNDEKDLMTCLLFSHFLAFYKTDDAMVTAGHLEEVNIGVGKKKEMVTQWRIAESYKIEVADGDISFL